MTRVATSYLWLLLFIFKTFEGASDSDGGEILQRLYENKFKKQGTILVSPILVMFLNDVLKYYAI